MHHVALLIMIKEQLVNIVSIDELTKYKAYSKKKSLLANFNCSYNLECMVKWHP